MLESMMKRLLLIVGAVTLFAGAPAISHAEDVTAQDVTGEVSVLAPQDSRKIKLTRDRNVDTYARLVPGEGYSCSWTEEEAVSGVYIKWYTPPVSAILVQIDAQGEPIEREALDNALYDAYYPLLPQARGLTFVSEEETMLLSELTLYSSGVLPEGVYDWQLPAKKADLLVVSAHCDDELLYFGGTIPTYAGERGLTVQVAYMANGERVRVEEALAGLWHLGVRNAPVFLPFRDAYTESLKDALRRWGEDETTRTLVTLIRRFRPEVIVTHDLGGEYGHGAHMATAYCVQKAVSLAVDAAQDPDSAKDYGAWQVQKLYLHLYGENSITMDWRVPLAAFGGKTALELANEAYAMHTSQQQFHQNVYDSGDYNSAKYGLAESMVGTDEAKNDFFEHIEPSLLTNYRTPEPESTPESTAPPIPTPVRAVESSEVEEAREKGAWHLNGWVWSIVAITVGAIAICAIYLFRSKERRKQAEQCLRKLGVKSTVQTDERDKNNKI